MVLSKNTKIVIVCGGVSNEREISLKSGHSVYNALKAADYQEVTLFKMGGVI